MLTRDQISQDIKSHDVLVYMKGDPENSPCGYSTRLVSILDHIGLKFETRDILQSEELRSGVKTYTGVRTLPQLFVKGNYVGGSDDIRAMHEDGSLIAFFEGRGIATAVDPSQGQLTVGDISREQVIACSKAS